MVENMRFKSLCKLLASFKPLCCIKVNYESGNLILSVMKVYFYLTSEKGNTSLLGGTLIKQKQIGNSEGNYVRNSLFKTYP